MSFLAPFSTGYFINKIMQEILAKLPRSSLCVAISSIFSDTPAVAPFTGLLRLEIKKFYLPYVKTLFHTCFSALLIELHPILLEYDQITEYEKFLQKGSNDIANNNLYK